MNCSVSKSSLKEPLTCAYALLPDNPVVQYILLLLYMVIKATGMSQLDYAGHYLSCYLFFLQF